MPMLGVLRRIPDFISFTFEHPVMATQYFDRLVSTQVVYSNLALRILIKRLKVHQCDKLLKCKLTYVSGAYRHSVTLTAGNAITVPLQSCCKSEDSGYDQLCSMLSKSAVSV
jgi:hypothetical protein